MRKLVDVEEAILGGVASSDALLLWSKCSVNEGTLLRDLETLLV